MVTVKTCYFYLFSVRMQQKSSWSSLGPSQMDSSLLNNIQKLFSERIDLSGMVEPNKGSVVMAIIKICLKVKKAASFLISTAVSFSVFFFIGIFGMRSSQDFWKVWYPADTGGLLLPATFLMEIYFR